MKTETEIITPAVARRMLEANVGNRDLRPSTVEGLRLAFMRGEYIQTHQGIAFSASGRLIDGQHRLTAITMMPDGFKVAMQVTRGLPEDAFKVLDIGVKRTAGDVLNVSQGLAAVARWFATIVETQRAGITPQLLVGYVHGCEDAYMTLTTYCPTVTKTWSCAAVRAAAILRMLNGGDQDYVMLSYHALNHAEFDSMSRVVQALYRQHLKGGVRVSGMDLFARAYKAFDVRRQSMDKIQINDQSAFVAEARELVLSRILRQKKAAPVMSAAKKVTGANSTRRLAI